MFQCRTHHPCSVCWHTWCVCWHTRCVCWHTWRVCWHIWCVCWNTWCVFWHTWCVCWNTWCVCWNTWCVLTHLMCLLTFMVCFLTYLVCLLTLLVCFWHPWCVFRHPWCVCWHAWCVCWHPWCVVFPQGRDCLSAKVFLTSLRVCATWQVLTLLCRACLTQVGQIGLTTGLVPAGAKQQLFWDDEVFFRFKLSVEILHLRQNHFQLKIVLQTIATWSYHMLLATTVGEKFQLKTNNWICLETKGFLENVRLQWVVNTRLSN